MGRRVARIVFVSGLLALGAGAMAAPPDSRVIRVSKNEAAQQTGIHYNTIQGAIDSLTSPASAPVVILVSPGEYAENVVLDRANVSIVGAIPGSVIVAPSTGIPLEIDSADTSTFGAAIDALTLRATGSGMPALKIEAWDESYGARSLVVSNCDIYSSTAAAVDNDDAAGLVIEDSRLRGSGVVVDSDVSTTAQALEIRDSLLTHSTTTTGQYAISLSAGGLLVHGSTFRGGTHGTNAVQASGSIFKLLRECALDQQCLRAFDDAATNAAIAGCTYDQGVFSMFWGANTRMLDYEGPTTGSVVIGRNAYTEYDQTISIGKDSMAWGEGVVAIGRNALAGEGDDGVAIGTSSSSAYRGVAIGKSAVAGYDRATAVGADASAGTEGVAIGSGATAYPYSTAIGVGAEAENSGSVALGYGAATTASSQVALGASGHEVWVPGTLDVDDDADFAGNVTVGGDLEVAGLSSTGTLVSYGLASFDEIDVTASIDAHTASLVDNLNVGGTASFRRQVINHNGSSALTLTAAQSGAFVRSSSLYDVILPAAETGLWFVIQAPSPDPTNFAISAQSGDNIEVLVESSTQPTIYTTSAKGCITLLAVNSTTWTEVGASSTWTALP